MCVRYKEGKGKGARACAFEMLMEADESMCVCAPHERAPGTAIVGS